ncbi:hypothetical protein [Accumulibacter sp.]|uniref:type IV pilus assembly protein FimV n=1 Tax=Accumulibacter sp. TaxID=2053492 RepID=UPI0025808209|nr:hypothetical protein [Accumulibacter sp.]
MPVRAFLMHAGMRRFAPILFLLLLSFGIPGASAVVLGELRSSARVGQVLQAEIEVSEHPAERFDPACLKLFRPQAASDDLPWITEARLSYRREGGHGRLTVVSRAAIADPAVHLGVRSECAAGASRQYTILLADPAAVVASPRGPGAASAAALGKTDSRPAASDAPRPPVAAVPPPQRAPAAVAESVRGGRAAAAKGEAAPLSTSDELSEPPTTSGLGRELLRLEQRALGMLNDPADDQEAMSNKLAWLEANVAELKRATERLQGGAAALPGGNPAGESRLPAAAGAASAPAVAVAQGGAPLAVANVPSPALPVRSEPPPSARSQPATPAAAGESGSWLIYGAGAAALLLLLSLLLVRRRRAAAAIEPLQPATAQAPARTAFGDSQFSLTPDAAAAVPIEQMRPRASASSIVSSGTPSGTPAAAVPSAAAARESTPSAAAATPAPVDYGVGGAAPAMELAEIMLSFGRVTGAARTLEEYIAALPQESARPWIRLLHLYRRNGMGKEFEALTVKLNRNFNVEILAWETGKASGELELVPLSGAATKAETLEDIPRLRDEIVALWGKPECQDYLEKLLRDNRQGKRKGFPLAIAEEVLFLIDLAAARDAAR